MALHGSMKYRVVNLNVGGDLPFVMHHSLGINGNYLIGLSGQMRLTQITKSIICITKVSKSKMII